MRSLAWLASILLHLAVVAAAFFLGTPTGIRVDLNAPVYQVELFSMSTEPAAPGMPGPATAEPPGAAPPPPPAEAKPIAAPKPDTAPPAPAPKPEPKPDLKAIAAKQAEEKKRLEDEKRKAEEEAKRKAEEDARRKAEEKKKADAEKKRKAEEEKKKREQILKDALKAAADEAKKKDKADAASVQRELDALRKEVASGTGPAATAARQGSGTGGGGGPAGSNGTGIGSIAAYGRVVEQLIKANWRFPSATAKNPLVTQVEIRVAVDGSISGFRMLGSSGRPDFDASALRAIQDTKALPPPPSPDLSVLIINFNNQE